MLNMTEKEARQFTVLLAGVMAARMNDSYHNRRLVEEFKKLLQGEHKCDFQYNRGTMECLYCEEVLEEDG